MDEFRSRQQDAAAAGHVFQRGADDRDLRGVRSSTGGLPVHHRERSEVFHPTKSGHRPSIRLDMLKDLRHGIRTLLHAKGWTAVVVVSLALGIGANTALFSAINGLYLRKLPVKGPDTLVRLRWLGRNDMATNSSDYGPGRRVDGQNVRATVSFPMYLQY